jgi:hypothetical protein
MARAWTGIRMQSTYKKRLRQLDKIRYGCSLIGIHLFLVGRFQQRGLYGLKTVVDNHSHHNYNNNKFRIIII